MKVHNEVHNAGLSLLGGMGGVPQTAKNLLIPPPPPTIEKSPPVDSSPSNFYSPF